MFKTIFLSADSCKTNNNTVAIAFPSEDDIHCHLFYLPHASRPPQKGAVVGVGAGADAGSKDQQPARRLNHLAPNWELTRRCAPLSRSKVAQPPLLLSIPLGGHARVRKSARGNDMSRIWCWA